MDLSLDEYIIMNKKNSSGAPKKFTTDTPKREKSMHKTLRKPAFKVRSRRVEDARMKIIERNRSRIRDAREVLGNNLRSSGFDARERLLQMKNEDLYKRDMDNIRSRRVKRERYGLNNDTKFGRTASHKRIVKSPAIINVPRGYVDYDNMERMEQEEYGLPRTFTVKNDLPPPAPRRLNSWGSDSAHDPFDLYDPPERGSRDILPPPPPKGILRSTCAGGSVSGSTTHSIRGDDSNDLYVRRHAAHNNPHLSYAMRSRLEHAPNPHASCGIFAKESASYPTTTNVSLSSHNFEGYRIVISNLYHSVTTDDIDELFRDIGPMYSARVVRPGVAEVVYKSLADADRAVDTYHNRQLDGQPMKCMLVNPRSSNNPTAPAMRTSSVLLSQFQFASTQEDPA